MKFAYICSVDVKGQRLPDLSKKSSKNILNIAFQNTREREGPTVQRTKQGNNIWTTITYYDYGIKDGAQHDRGTFLY